MPQTDIARMIVEGLYSFTDQPLQAPDPNRQGSEGDFIPSEPVPRFSTTEPIPPDGQQEAVANGLLALVAQQQYQQPGYQE